MIDAHPALKAASPQAPVTDWFIGDDWHHNGAFFLPHAFNFISGFGQPRPEPTQQSTGRGFEHGTPDGYEFFLELGPLAQRRRTLLQGRVAFWNEVDRARHLRRLLAGAQPAAAPQGHQAGGADRRRLVRRRGPVRAAARPTRAIEKQNPGTANTLVMGPWVHGGWSRARRRPASATSDFDAKTAEFYREQIELPFFEHHLKGKATHADLPEAWCSRRAPTTGARYDAWPPQAGARAAALLPAPGGRPVLPGAADGRRADVLRRVRQRPRQAGAVHDRTGHRHGAKNYMIEDQRFAATPAGRARLPDASR